MEPTQQTYKFDAILVKSKICDPETISDYTYSIRLFKNFEELPEDRMFVEDFPMDPLGQFMASPCELIGILTSKGVCVTVSKSGDLLGAGSALLTPLLLRQLTDPTFLVTETITLDLAKGRRVIESVEIIIKFSSLHPELDPGLVPLGCYDVCRPVDKSIDYRDVIFTLGRSAKSPCTSCITDQRLMSHTGAPFQCVHNDRSRDAGECGCPVAGGEIQPVSELHREQERGMLKKLFKELGLDKIQIPAPPCNYEESRRWHCQRCQQPDSSDTNSSDCLYDTWLEENKQSPDSAQLCLSASQQEQIRRTVLGYCRTKEPELKHEKYKRPNLCPLCRSDISWLPRVAGCPHCGYRNIDTMNSGEEFAYDVSATAQQLLRDCLRKEPCIVSSSEGDTKSEANVRDTEPNIPDACGCMSGRVCTRCRIRKLCDQFFTEQENKSQNAGGLRDESGGHSQKGPSLKQIPSSTSHHRSKLITIFSEMRNMYDKKKRQKGPEKNLQDDPKTAALRDECEATCNSYKSARDRRRARRWLEKSVKGIDKESKRKSKRKQCQARLHGSKSKRYTYLDIPKKVCPRIGHRRCISDSKYTGYCKIPCHMGWMWTKSDMARFKTWRPGAISRPIRQLMAYFLNDFPVDTISLSRYHYRNQKTDPEDAFQEPLVQHPTLHILKKRDEYIITLRPLKDPHSLALCANPYADMKPVVFRITKDPTAADLREMKMALNKKGFPPCKCNRPVASCYCRSHIDKKRLEYVVESMLRQRGSQETVETFFYSPITEDEGDSDSEEEYEFGVTPPAGVVKPERLKKSHVKHCETQYNENDWAMPSMFPHPPNPFVQYGACVLGERKKAFDWIYGKGNVHQEPKPPLKRNKPKTKKKKKELPGRQAGGFDDPNLFQVPSSTSKRNWHKSNYPVMSSFTKVPMERHWH